ncbi:hypothetical protein ACFX15_031951 [Malus domestica]
MDQRFHGLPHFKRFRLMQQKYAILSPSRLPARSERRRETNSFFLTPPPLLLPAPPIPCLPRKGFGRFSLICSLKSHFRHWTLMSSISHLLGGSWKKRQWRNWRKRRVKLKMVAMKILKIPKRRKAKKSQGMESAMKKKKMMLMMRLFVLFVRAQMEIHQIHLSSVMGVI